MLASASSRIAFADAAGKDGDSGGISTLVTRLEHYTQLHEALPIGAGYIWRRAEQSNAKLSRPPTAGRTQR
jgi:hypothetical protein